MRTYRLYIRLFFPNNPLFQACEVADILEREAKRIRKDGLSANVLNGPTVELAGRSWIEGKESA